MQSALQTFLPLRRGFGESLTLYENQSHSIPIFDICQFGIAGAIAPIDIDTEMCISRTLI